VKVLMLGPPGGGKGTQGTRLAHELGVPHISSGDVLREEVADDTPLGREVKAHMAQGRLAPDDLVTRAIRPKLEHLDGYVLDGYPRTLAQADGLDFDAVVHLDVPDAVIERRLQGRGRADDRPEVIRERLREYERDTAPLIDHYQGVLVDVDGDRPEDEIAADLLTRLRRA
jgi:adenylate kinase